ncbi:hypothetical protein F4776DRAFT_665420 [Hypoxylon sp. NC0597]|nr:hypothetical protein F4776DRAFT_665420 [Hypoxylon sp. NC0597]
MTEPLARVDSAVQGLSTSPPKEKVSHRRTSSSAAGISSMKDMWESRTKIQVAPETQGTGWKINTPPSKVDDKEILSKLLITPPVRAVNLHFEHGVVVTARNSKGVTIKDALEVIHRPNKKRADDELPEPYLKGFEWVPSHTEYGEGEEEKAKEDWQRLLIHLSSTPGVSNFGGKKKKKAAE